MPQDCATLAQINPKTPKIAPEGLPRTSRWAQTDSRWHPSPKVLASWSLLHEFQKHINMLCFPLNFVLWVLWKYKFLLISGTEFDWVWINFGILGLVCLKGPQDRFKIASSWLPWANLEPTWAQVGSKLSHVVPMLAPSWLQLDSSWSHVGSISGSPAAPGPTQGLANLFPVASWPPKPPLDLKWNSKGPPKPWMWTLDPLKTFQSWI